MAQVIAAGQPPIMAEHCSTICAALNVQYAKWCMDSRVTVLKLVTVV